MIIDIWYKVDAMDCFFSDCDGVYHGNLYAKGKPVGDYMANNSKEVEMVAARFGITWDWDIQTAQC